MSKSLQRILSGLFCFTFLNLTCTFPFPYSQQKYYGRKSAVGRDVCRLRKAYYGARHEAAVQIDEIVGETASEADSSDSLERDHAHHQHDGGGSHDKDDDVIRCICGMYKDEGLMIQCEKCMVCAHI